eukprot:CAMPEP_0204584638 /NCGR_PEP_ID=MMETSP0661-20131031/46458_1 /ASSEMBLY_ACC=CAM_ASM_000606 /TAXON_ID=109239 /ORGANISM="Alexandrium margalefi, Strain AMGDE01CS-322" /LENGTH=37 /DNA_ID= /DNA_START= /DNA_END= /DNA_ORIENTATION=
MYMQMKTVRHADCPSKLRGRLAKAAGSTVKPCDGQPI